MWTPGVQDAGRLRTIISEWLRATQALASEMDRDRPALALGAGFELGARDAVTDHSLLGAGAEKLHAVPLHHPEGRAQVRIGFSRDPMDLGMHECPGDKRL